MSAADIDKGTVEAAEWAGELFGAYAQHGGEYEEGSVWMTRGMMAFLGVSIARSQMQTGESVDLTLRQCIEKGIDALQAAWAEEEGSVA